MISSVAERRPSYWPAAVACGLWAAAVAAAPTLTAKAVLAAPALLIAIGAWTLARPARWISAFLAAALLLPPLPIAIGDSGPHPALIFAALGFFAGLVWMGEWRLRVDGVRAPMIALWGIMLASVGLAAIHSGEEVAAASLARVLLFGISLYVFFFTADGPGGRGFAGIRPLRSLPALYWIGAASAAFAIVDFYFQLPAPAGYGPQFVWLDTGVFRRAQGLFYEAGTLGNFCAFSLVLIAVAFSRRRQEAPVSRMGLIAGGALFFVALVLSYSRASVVNVLVAAGVLAWRNRRRVRLVRALPVLAALVGVGAYAVWEIFPRFAELYWNRLAGSAQFFFSATDGILSGRLATWQTLLDWISAHPWQTLIGIGYKTLPYTTYLGAPIVADNMYLSLLVETGVAGLAALIWLNVAILRSSARAAGSKNPHRAFLGTWMLCFWAGQVVQMFSVDLLTYWRLLPLYFWVLALAEADA